MSSDDELNNRFQGNPNEEGSRSIATKRKKRVQFLEDEDEDIPSIVSPTKSHYNKKSKLSQGNSHQKEFLESVLFDSAGSSDEDDVSVNQPPIVTSDSPFKTKHRHPTTTTTTTTSTNAGSNKGENTTVDHYTRNILDRMDFSDSDEMDDFIEHDDPESAGRTERAKSTRNLSSSLTADRNINFGPDFGRTKPSNDRSYNLAMDIFGDDFQDSRTQLSSLKYGSDGREESVSEDESVQGELSYFSQSNSVYDPRNIVQKSIHELFEPSELKRQFLTNVDESIRNKDVPERFQLRSNPVGPADEEELEMEAKWIYDNFIGSSPLLLTNDKRQSTSALDQSKKIAPCDYIGYIKTALDLIRNELCEVPFIVTYRHENINRILTEDELWTVYNADNKWCSFYNKIKQFHDYLKRFQRFQSSPQANDINFNYHISDRDFQYLESVSSETEFYHFHQKIQFYICNHKNEFVAYESTAEDSKVGPGESHSGSPQKEPRSFSRHHFYVSKDIEKVVGCFGLSSSHFDENVQMEYQRHVPACSLESPTTVAEKYVSSVFDSAEKVLEAAVDMYTLELSHEQHIRRYIHQLFLKHARLNVSPTKVGLEQIDESHPFCAFKYIINKPVKGITSEMMLKLNQAKAEKLLDVSISLPEHIISELKDYLKSFQNCAPSGANVTSGNHRPPSRFAKEWGDLRCSAIERVVHSRCLPLAESDIHKQLVREAQNDLIRRCGDVFNRHLIHSPYVLQLKNEHSAAVEKSNNFDSDSPMIMVISLPSLSSNNGAATISTTIDGKRQSKYFHMKAIGGRINHPSFSTNENQNSNETYDNEGGDHSQSTIANSSSSNVVGVTNDEIGYVVVMNEGGECVDYVTVNRAILHAKSNDNGNQRNHPLDKSRLKFAEISFGKIEKMLSKYWISAVFVPLIDRQYNHFAENFQTRLQSMAKRADLTKPPNVYLVNPYISNRMVKVLIKQDPSWSKKIEYQRAISVGRYALDPLVECANLYVNDSESLTFLADLLPPYQQYLDVDKVKAVLEEKLVTIVNEIGVDLNKACGVTWYSNLVQFVCGFGPRKAQRLLTDIRSSTESGRLNNRTQLVTMCNLGPKIFINCAGFLKIEGSADEEGDVDLLDATRIHPELYDWTRKIMIDALDVEDPNTIDGIDLAKKHDFNDMLITLRANPSKLKELDLDVFADELMRQGISLNRRYSLELITIEMLKEFPDYRPRFKALNDAEKFWILANGGNRIDLCGTSEYSNVTSKHSATSELSRFHNEDLIPVYPGKYVSFVCTRFICRRPDQEEISKAVPEKDMDTQLWKCPFCFDHISTDLKVCWDHIENVCPGNAVAVSGIVEGLYGAITGTINLSHVSDNPPKSIKERVRKLMHITCVVLEVKFDRLAVTLTCRSSDLCDKPNNCYKFKRDAYYDSKAEEHQRQLKKELKEKLKKQVVYQKKVIIHPCFKNITFAEAEKQLETAPIGECVIRPSSKGADHLTVTWKVHDNIYHHIDIIEKDKPNFFSLGKKLWIKGECYDDLDEIIARHIEPMSALMKEASTLKVFNYAEGGSRHKMASILSEEKKSNPLRIPYVFSPSKIYPGKLLLGFLPRNTPLFEYVSLTPEGVKFRDIIHQSMNDLIKWFKLNFNQSTLNSAYSNNATSIGGGGSVIKKTPNIYHTPADKLASHATPGRSMSPLTGNIKKIGIKNIPSITSIPSLNPLPHSYLPTSGGFRKRQAP